MEDGSIEYVRALHTYVYRCLQSVVTIETKTKILGGDKLLVTIETLTYVQCLENAPKMCDSLQTGSRYLHTLPQNAYSTLDKDVIFSCSIVMTLASAMLKDPKRASCIQKQNMIASVTHTFTFPF